MKAIVPVKKSSIRVPNKNFREFYNGKSLFDLKMEALLRVLAKEDIFVSSESSEVETEAARYGANFLLRDTYYSENSTPMAEVIPHLVNRLPGDDDILWAQVTEPFFEDFDKCIEKWDEISRDRCIGPYDSLIVVKPFQSYLLDASGEPINFSFGYWAKPSQKLPKWYLLPFSAHIMSRKNINKYNYYIGKTPYLYEYNSITFDIDSVDDFNQAAAIYKVVKEK